MCHTHTHTHAHTHTHYMHPTFYLPGRVSLVEVEASLHANDRASRQVAEDQVPLVAHH